MEKEGGVAAAQGGVGRGRRGCIKATKGPWVVRRRGRRKFKKVATQKQIFKTVLPKHETYTEYPEMDPQVVGIRSIS
ncbi:hypothetical protein OPV22_025377 [Ensete ventricosum]|uniref:Uncharacterized protein n=1 Tax=Ensete ventricosum TaxID=4639 RepID=A0AAV8QJ42_ENSVE|nr:hypothetical protein OPV22_025377 [Ensete ventricosum]